MYTYGVHIGIGKTSACVHRCINTVASWSHRWQRTVRGADVSGHSTETNRVGTEPLIFLGRKYTCKHYFGKGLWITDFQKCLLLNHYSETIYRNLYRKICDVLFEILSQIVQITTHFAVRYRRIVHCLVSFPCVLIKQTCSCLWENNDKCFQLTQNYYHDLWNGSEP